MAKSENSIKLTREEALFIKELVSRNDRLLRNVLKLVLADSYDMLVDECIGETHLLACIKIGTLKVHPNPDGWIIKAAKLKAHEISRKSAETKGVSIDTVAGLSSGTDVYDEALYRILKESFCTDELLPRLTKREKQVFRALFVEKRSIAKTAALLGVSEKTVLNTKSLIIGKAKKLLQ